LWILREIFAVLLISRLEQRLAAPASVSSAVVMSLKVNRRSS